LPTAEETAVAAPGTRRPGPAAGRSRASAWPKTLVFVACLAPFLWLLWRSLSGRLSANPIEDVTLTTGRWTLRFLVLTLAVTPVRRLTGWNGVIRFRRMLGLYAFFYATLHFLTYLVLDQFFAWHYILADIAKRPYITVGFAAFLLLTPLALTSTAKMVRRLGGRRWSLLHRLVYLSAALGVVHYYWKVKADTRDPLAYGAVVLTLLLIRAGYAARRALSERAAARRPGRQPA
jgi:methionine sulfoxide reductase heme-binding subunit